MPILKNPKHEIFAGLVARGVSHQEAAIRAGYRRSKHTHGQASAIIAIPSVRARIEALREAASYRAELSAARVLEEIRRLAFSDLAGFFDENGDLKKISDLTQEQSAAICQSETILKNAAAGDRKTDRIHKLRLHDKTKALEMLGKFYGLLTERIEHQGDISFRWLSGNDTAVEATAVEAKEVKRIQGGSAEPLGDR